MKSYAPSFIPVRLEATYTTSSSPRSMTLFRRIEKLTEDSSEKSFFSSILPERVKSNPLLRMLPMLLTMVPPPWYAGTFLLSSRL